MAAAPGCALLFGAFGPCAIYEDTHLTVFNEKRLTENEEKASAATKDGERLLFQC